MRLSSFALVLLLTSYAHGQRILATADSLILNSEYAAALTELTTAMKTIRHAELIQQINLKRAEAHIALQHYDEAAELIRSVLGQQPRTSIQAEARRVEGTLYQYLGRNEEALQSLLESERLMTASSTPDSLQLARVYTSLGLVHFNGGKTAQAEEQLAMALTIRQRLLPETHELIAGSYNDLGLVYSKSDPDKALSYYEKALPIYKKLHGTIHAKIAINNTNTGVIYQNLELYGDAINNLEASLETWSKIQSQPNPQKAFVLFQLGYTYQKMGNNANAEIYYKRALDEYIASYGTTHPDVAGVYNALGNLATSGAQFDKALDQYQAALRANVKGFSDPNPLAVPPAQDYYNGNYLLYSLMYKAQTLEARHFGKSLRFSDLKNSLAHLISCDSLIDRLRQQTSNESDKISLGAIANEVYADGVRIAAHMSTIAPSQRDYYREKSFYFAEKSKSAVLLEAISDSNAKSFAGIPTPMLEREQQLKSSIALCAQKLSQKPSPEEEASVRESLFSFNKQYQAFVRELEAQFPDYFNLKFNTTTPSIAALQSKLDQSTALVSYFIDDSKRGVTPSLYTFVITQGKLTVVQRVLPADFDRLLTGFRNSIYYQVPELTNTVGHTLYDVLIPSIPSPVKSLVIFPTGRLGVIPFEALVTNTVKKGGTPRYVLERFAVRYEFSASLALQKKQLTQRPASILLCAPVQFEATQNMNDLPGTETEVKAIGQLFTGRHSAMQSLLNETASETAVKEVAQTTFDVLHFATHGVVDEQNPELSRIYLRQTTTDDGYLYSGEIYNLKLAANLVTLSACQTGLGKISRGEGVIGLSRALAYAGAENIIVSFWSVADESTAQLMTNFYSEALKDNSGFASSLQFVKKQMLLHPNYSAPYYWAAFVLIGF